MKKVVQRRVYGFLSTRWGVFFALFSIVITANSFLLLLALLLRSDSHVAVDGAPAQLSRDSLSAKSACVLCHATGGFGMDWDDVAMAASADNIGGRNFHGDMSPLPIDVVYTWVNGSDPDQEALLNRYLELWEEGRGGNTSLATSSSAGSSNTSLNETEVIKDYAIAARFADHDELKYSLRSLERFAPWVRKIWIVTNGQVPSWLDLSNPRVEIVTHAMIFRNLSQLPTFSSPAIEANLHRIRGLSRYFLYFNDDVMVGSPIWPEDFLTKSRGQKVYLAWAIPYCAPGCPPSWIADNHCDRACNVSACDFDGGDCENVTDSQLSWWSGGGGGGRFSRAKYCSPGCPDTWIGDRFCDRSCKNPQCGFDAGDCGLELIEEAAQKNEVYLVNVTLDTTNVTIPRRYGSAFLLLRNVFGAGSTITEGSHNNEPLIRIATISQKHKLMTLLFNQTFRFRRRACEHVQLVVTGIVHSIPFSKEINVTFGCERNTLLAPGHASSNSDGSVGSLLMSSSSNGSLDEPVNPDICGERGRLGSEASSCTVVEHDGSGSVRPRGDFSSSSSVSIQISGSNKPEESAPSPSLTSTGASPPPADDTIELEPEEAEQERLAKQTQDHTQGPNVRRVLSAEEHSTNARGKEILLDLLERQKEEASLLVRQLMEEPASDESTLAILNLDAAHRKEQQNVIDTFSLRPLPPYFPSSERSSERPVDRVIQRVMSSPLGKERKSIGHRSLHAVVEGADMFGKSLVFVNKLMNERFGAAGRRTLAHMAHFIDRDLMEEVQDEWPDQWDATSSHRFRASTDMQFAFSYYYYLMHSAVEPKASLEDFLNHRVDTDHDGLLSYNEIRTLACILAGGPVRDRKVLELFAELTGTVLPPEPVIAPNTTSSRRNRSMGVYSWRGEHYAHNLSAVRTLDEKASRDDKIAGHNVSTSGISGDVREQQSGHAEDGTEDQNQGQAVTHNGDDNDDSLVRHLGGRSLHRVDDPFEGMERLVRIEALLQNQGLCDRINRARRNEYHYRYEIMDANDVSHFVEMRSGDVTSAKEDFDRVRFKPRKFLCVNDNMDMSVPGSDEVARLLKEFYESVVPFPSQFELDVPVARRIGRVGIGDVVVTDVSIRTRSLLSSWMSWMFLPGCVFGCVLCYRSCGTTKNRAMLTRRLRILHRRWHNRSRRRRLRRLYEI